MTDVKSTIYQRGDGQMIVTTGPTTCCFGSKRTAAEFIAMYQEELLLTKQRLAAAEAACDTTSQQVSNLVMLVGRLVHQVRKYDETNDVAEKAMDYLRRKDLMPSILRGVGGESAKGGRDENGTS